MTRFARGTSGNPQGRPRKRKPVEGSAFDIIFDQTITVAHDGKSRELTVEEGLHFKTYQAAIGGSKPARREVFRMIARREAWLARRRPTRTPMQVVHEHDARNADQAMLILGIASRADARGPNDAEVRLHLEPWAVEAAIARMRPKRMKAKQIEECQRCTRDSARIRWPEVDD